MTDAGPVRVVEDVSFTLETGETVGLVGELGCGKSVTAMAIMGLNPSPPSRVDAGRIVFEGRDLLELGAGDARRARRPHRHDLSGADDQPQPDLHRRIPDRRGPAHPPRPEQVRGARCRGRAARHGRHRGARASPRSVPPRAFGRSAPARHDRHGDRLPAGAADRRRTDDGARRHHPGPDPRPDQAPAARNRHVGAADHPRPRHRRRGVRARHRHVRRAHRRAG